MEICTLGPTSSADSPVRATSASILAISPTPPIEFGPARRRIDATPATTQIIIGTEYPLTALVACNWGKKACK